ncbi:MAG: hypothetical protein IT372_35600 [Polyangiaceae bacterium]|nr:hypothetical protein [Polyangiaceae bacterium]
MSRRVVPIDPFQREEPQKDQFSHLSEQERAALKELAEVERAIAILEGRSDASPEDIAFARKEAERLRQSLGSALEKTEENIRAARRARLVRTGVIFGVLGVLGLAAALTIPIVTLWLNARARATEAAERAAAPFLAAGFTGDGATRGLEPREIRGERGRCYVVVAGSADGPARVRVERAPLSMEGASAGFCACGPDPVRVTPSGKEPVELRVLSAPPSLVGGADLLPIFAARPEARFTEEVDRACAEEAIDLFIGAHQPVEPAGAAPAAEVARLVSLGLRRVATSRPGLPLVTVPDGREACFLAISSDPSDALDLRLKGGERPLKGKRAPLAACGRELSGLSFWHEGKGDVTVFTAPIQRVGGLLGMRELAARAVGQRREAALWAPAEDLPFDAAATLLASGITPLRPDDPDSHPEVKAGFPAWLVALSTDDRSMLDVADSTRDALCVPPVRVGVAHSLCLETAPDALEPQTLPPGLARAKRPLWLPVARGNRAQNEKVLAVLAFARRLSAAGYDQTTLMGFTEVPGGVEVTGRSGEDEIVAITVSVSPPYVHVLTDGPAWTIDGEPRAVALAAGKSVKLRALPPLLGPKSGRETIVWRR